jgi:tocopherol O-methyltransferase
MEEAGMDHPTDQTPTQKVRRFYDLGSPLYLEVYGENIHDGYYTTGSETRQQAQVNLTRLIAKKAGIKSRARILDVGCGMGGSSIWLSENLHALTTGITVSPVQVEIATRLARERKVNSTFRVMDAEDMHFSELFDALWVVAASTHFRSQEKFVRSASAFLKKGGKFVVFDWMADEEVADPATDRFLRPVCDGMLLNSLCSINQFLDWFIRYGYRVTFAEDVTERTFKTWDDALTVIKEPSTWKLAARVSKDELGEILRFLRSVSAMRLAMKHGKMRSGIIVAERL